jgi:hypothetical protein
MDYLWAGVRTIGILFSGLVALFLLALVISGVVQAFIYLFVVGCLVLAVVFGALSLFGHQLASVAKIPRTKLIGTYTRLCCGSIAALSLAVPLATYGYTTARHVLASASRGLSDAEVWPGTPVPPPPRGFTEDATGAKPRIDPSAMSDDELRAAYAREQGVAKSPQAPAVNPAYGDKPGMFDDLIPKLPVTASSSPTCDEALIVAYKASRGARTGNIPHAAGPCVVTNPTEIAAYNTAVAANTNNPKSDLTKVSDAALIMLYCKAMAKDFGKLAEHYAALAKCYAPYPSIGVFDDVPFEAPDFRRDFRIDGWEIHAPADTTDETVVRVLDALSGPASVLAPPKSP